MKSPFGFLTSWLGNFKKDPVPRDTEDGMFLAYPLMHGVTDWSLILRGASDVTGQKWAKYNKGKPCLNSEEMKEHWTVFVASGPDDPALDRIRSYTGPLNENPHNWPTLYRDAWFEGHPRGSKGRLRATL